MLQTFKQLCKLLIAAFILTSFSVSNAFTISEYKKQLENPVAKDLVEFYLAGMGAGMLWSNSILGARGKSMFMCPPAEMPLTNDLFVSILNKAVSENRFKESDNIALVLVIELGRVFPCN